MPGTSRNTQRTQQAGRKAKSTSRDPLARYRDEWRWDRVVWGTHFVDCYPSNCPYRVYVRDGEVFVEEQRGTLPVIEKGVPDMNPMGCQKGAVWSRRTRGWLIESWHLPCFR